jgi:two-component system sensor histidine kinase/response regulator
LDGTPQRVGMDLGADDYLAKPFTMDEFLNCVSVRLQRSQLYKKAEDRALVHFRETISHSLPHEVFTPLTGILGFTEVLREEIGRVSPAEASKMVAEIHVSAERLYRTLRHYLRILDVLNDKNPPSLTEERTRSADVCATILNAAESVTGRYGREGNFTLECADLDVPLSSTDLATVVVELVDNACKYSVAGTPVVVRLQSTADGIKLAVIDRGRGMTPDQIAQIGAFRQFDRKKYEQQGLGLGLTLTQHLVERHGGSFQLDSPAGAGTIVTATWPR